MRNCVFCFGLVFLFTNVKGEEGWKQDFHTLSCSVDSVSGVFNSFSASPVPGSKVEIDIPTLVRSASAFKFTSQRTPDGESYIPYSEPFRVEKRIVNPALQYSAQRFVSKNTTGYSVILDIRNGAHFAPNAISSVILVEQDVTIGACFLSCRRVD